MRLDKRVWQEAIANYKKWNDDVLACQVLGTDRKTPAEKWNIFLDLYAVGCRIKPQPSQWEQMQTAREWETYYARIQEFEKRRGPHGQATGRSPTPSDQVPG